MVKIGIRKTMKLSIPAIGTARVPVWLNFPWKKKNRRNVSTVSIAWSSRVLTHPMPDTHLSSLPSISPRRGLTVSCVPGVTGGNTAWKERIPG
jgi:hypothetical protein